MASVLGYAGLKSKLNDWRGWRGRSAPQQSSEMQGEADGVDPDNRTDAPMDLPMLLENLVIPKLIAGCQQPAQSHLPMSANAAPQPRQSAISNADVEKFTALCVREDAPTLLDFAERFLAAGHSVETIYIGLLAPAARKLGEHWESDGEDFVGVTMGLWRIQEVLRELTLKVPPEARPGGGLRASLFSTMPGDQHSFGTLMVAECFERSGWQADVLIEPTQSELIAKSARQHYDLIGLTVSCDCSSAALAGVVTAIRAVSSNPCVKILVGGSAITRLPAMVTECGADGTATDAASAVVLADRLVPLKAESPTALL